MIPRLYPDFDLSFQDMRRTLPAVAFFAGFVWDALTLGRAVNALDLWLLSLYLSAAAGVLWFLGCSAHFRAATPIELEQVPPDWRQSAPYLLLQFLFGGLFSALFIFYFKSSSHLLATLWALGLGILLVANEFLEEHYRRFTLNWLLFGLCAMLLLNFVVPHLVGSVAAFWFYLSTFAGAALAHWLRLKTPGTPGRIRPMWSIAGGLVLAYSLDVIPPVPLVKRDILVGHALTRVEGTYQLKLEKTPWWQFWRSVSNDVHQLPGERIYCLSAVFAPTGLEARLVHRWQRYDDKHGWVTHSRIGFALAGGREGGFRGYTYKENLQPGEWKIAVETENGRTVGTHRFTLSSAPATRDIDLLERRI